MLTDTHPNGQIGEQPSLQPWHKGPGEQIDGRALVHPDNGHGDSNNNDQSIDTYHHLTSKIIDIVTSNKDDRYNQAIATVGPTKFFGLLMKLSFVMFFRPKLIPIRSFFLN